MQTRLGLSAVAVALLAAGCAVGPDHEAPTAPAPSRIALIGVYGPLTPRGSWYGSSLSGIASQVARAALHLALHEVHLEVGEAHRDA